MHCAVVMENEAADTGAHALILDEFGALLLLLVGLLLLSGRRAAAEHFGAQLGAASAREAHARLGARPTAAALVDLTLEARVAARARAAGIRVEVTLQTRVAARAGERALQARGHHLCRAAAGRRDRLGPGHHHRGDGQKRDGRLLNRHVVVLVVVFLVERTNYFSKLAFSVQQLLV